MKTLELGGFAGMRCEDKDGIQIVSVIGEVDLYSRTDCATFSGTLRGRRTVILLARWWI